MGYGFYQNLSQSTYTWMGVFALIMYVLYAIGLWKMFTKAGEAGWKALIPFYNMYILFKIAWQGSMFWWYLGLSVLSGALIGWGIGGMNDMLIYIGYAISIVTMVIWLVELYNVSLAYGHGLGYFIGLAFLQGLFTIIIGFGSSQYVGNRYENALE